ncbi:hypothetical protein SAY86_000510 [Trapa natans]|uniref:Uncharacterized protein n=1 Tax=Trapa natans TaxID=22666 RepID=A0AAN7RFR0_TRANT|nr:hypothetical protein SAY86_000510 [Trapa natans]
MKLANICNFFVQKIICNFIKIFITYILKIGFFIHDVCSLDKGQSASSVSSAELHSALGGQTWQSLFTLSYSRVFSQLCDQALLEAEASISKNVQVRLLLRNLIQLWNFMARFTRACMEPETSLCSG